MQSLKIFISLIFVAIFSTPVGAQQLWNGTVYGMSESTIKNMFPKVVSIKNNNSSESNITSIYELDKIDLEGDIFTAKFFFKKGKLIRVVLSSGEIEEKYWINKRANRLEEIITYKYGAPYESDARHTNKSVRWKNGKTEIILSIYEAPSDLKIKIAPIAIIYDADFLDAASKL